MDMPHDKRFYFPDGSAAKNLNELKEKLEVISYSDYYHHVADGRNDFANWVRYVLGDPHLADDLEKVESIVETVEILDDYLHPAVAKQHLTAEDDMQSKIEKEVGIADIPEGHEDAAVPEPEAPAQEPVPAPESTLEPEAVSESEPKAKAELSPEAEAVLYNKPKKEEVPEPEDDPLAEAVSMHYKREPAEKKEIESFHHDVGTLLVKDFIIGLLFGLAIGFILARMITVF